MDTRPSPLAAPDVAILLVVIGTLLLGGALLDAAGSVVRRHMEDQSWAEERCVALAPTETAETEEHWACVKRQLGKSDLEAVLPQLPLALAGSVFAISGIVFRRRQGRRGRVMESFVDGSA
jgi:hypothetical protein